MSKSKIDIKTALMKAGANAGGGVAAIMVNKIPLGKNADDTPRTVGSLSGLVRGGAKLVLGALLPSFLKDKKTKAIVEDATAGWNAIAGVELANYILTKQGKEPTKAMSIGAAGDADVSGIGSTDAAYVLDEAYEEDGINGVDDNDVS